MPSPQGNVRSRLCESTTACLPLPQRIVTVSCRTISRNLASRMA